MPKPFDKAGADSACRGFRLTAPDASREWLLLVHRLDARSSPDASTTFLLHAVGRIRARAIPVEALHDLFGLTQQEAVVAMELLKNSTVDRVARRLSVAPETIRSHLKRSFRKCNVHSQAELLLFQCLAEFVPETS